MLVIIAWHWMPDLRAVLTIAFANFLALSSSGMKAPMPVLTSIISP